MVRKIHSITVDPRIFVVMFESGLNSKITKGLPKDAMFSSFEKNKSGTYELFYTSESQEIPKTIHFERLDV